MVLGVRGRRQAVPLPSVPTLETEVEFDREAVTEAGAELVEQWRRVCREQREFSARLRRFDIVNAHSAEGCLTTAAFLRSRCQMTAAEAGKQVTVARQLEELPAMEAAYAEGAISFQHTAVIATCARKLGLEEVAPREEILVTAARRLDPFRLGLVVQHLEQMADGEGTLEFFEQQHERRRVEFSRTSDGMWVLKGLFDGEGGAVIAEGLDKLMGAPAADDGRPVWQKRADALVEVFLEGAPKPQLTVIAELDTLKGLRGAPGGELRDSLMIPAAAVQRIACDCGFEVARILEDGVHVELSATTRSVPPGMRRMLELRDRHCRFDGCLVPASRCDAHHLLWVEQGGRTVLCNLVLFCRRHHRLAHEKGWSFEWGENGALLALPP